MTISSITYSQNVFNETYDIDSLYDGFETALELDNGDWIVAGQAFELVGTRYSYFARTDRYGVTLWEKK